MGESCVRDKEPSLRERWRRRRQTLKAGRISNRALIRLATNAMADAHAQEVAMRVEHNNAFLVLLTVLAQKGGEVTITQGTIDQVSENFRRLGFSVQPSPDHAGEFVVRMVETDDKTLSDGGTLPAPDSLEPQEPDVVPLTDPNVPASLVPIPETGAVDGV